MADDLTSDIVEAALEPAEAAGDQGSVKSRSIEELIKADQYAKGTEAAKAGVNPWQMCAMARFVPPGGS